MENLDNTLLLHEKNNVFLIDWLTVVFFSDTVAGIQLKLGLDADVPWETKHSFKHGYPMETSWSNISIRWGADDPVFYKDDEKKTAAEKVRTDMGIELDLSGQGCRTFEQFSKTDWFGLLTEIFRSEGRVHITRLDLAYDDHIGLLDIYEIEKDTRDRYYVSKSKKSRITWSDDQAENIQGLTIEIGSRASEVLIRIYDKAAERGYNHDKHWIRVELQLRKDRAHEAARKLFQRDRVGVVAAGILRNYCTFRTLTNDSNKSRWPIAPYWDKLIMDMEKISIWIAPGEPYNFKKSENHFIHQYAQFIQAYFEINGDVTSMLDRSRKAHPKLDKKYHAAIAAAKMHRYQRRKMIVELEREYGIPEHIEYLRKRREEEERGCFETIPGTVEEVQLEMREIFGDRYGSDLPVE